MTTHYDEQLHSLLNGELSGDDVRAVVGHLRECGPCTSELISVAVAHGALRGARRTMAPAGIDAQVPPVTQPLPPLDLPLRRRGRWVGGLAAALILVVGAFGVLKVVAPAPGAPVAAQATLHDLDASASAAGTVSVRTTNYALQMSVSTKGLPSAPANHFYEVWLLAPETNKMLPLGVLSPTGNGTYSISPTIMQQFSQIDVSLQVNNGSPEHSTTSVLRGTVTPV
jgi:hypothetical protein